MLFLIISIPFPKSDIFILFVFFCCFALFFLSSRRIVNSDLNFCVFQAIYYIFQAIYCCILIPVTCLTSMT